MTARLYKALSARRMCDLWAISAHVDPCVLLGHLRILTRAVNLASGRRTPGIAGAEPEQRVRERERGRSPSEARPGHAVVGQPSPT
jgi:hypothetical protein